jgi:hypothetical protein
MIKKYWCCLEAGPKTVTELDRPKAYEGKKKNFRQSAVKQQLFGRS